MNHVVRRLAVLAWVVLCAFHAHASEMPSAIRPQSEQTDAAGAPQEFCPILPLAIAESTIANATVGQRFNSLERGTGAGNFSWLTWTGANDAPTLAASLALPGDSGRYVDPDDTADHQLDLADFAQGAPGSMNASAVRERLDALLNLDIVLPLFDATRGQGSRYDYRVGRFALFRLLDYRLTGQGWISLEYRGPTRCYNDAPVALPQDLTTLRNIALPLVLAGSDPENDTLSFRVVDQPTRGRLVGNAPALEYLPSGDFVGTDGFTFTVSDGTLESAPATVQVHVIRIGLAPVAENQSREGPEDAPLGIVLAATDGDDDTLQFEVTSQPTHGTLTGTAPNLTYVPEAHFHGADQFRFHASDFEFTSGDATVNITILPLNDAPNAIAQSLHADEDKSLDIVLTGIDIDGDDLAFALGSQVAHGQLDGVPPTLKYTPSANFNGVDGFTFTVADQEQVSATAMVEIHVAPINDPPTAGDIGATTAESTSVAITLAAVDEEGDPLTYIVVEAPSRGTLSGTAPNLTYTPNAGYSGQDQIVWQAHDGHGPSSLATVVIDVTPVNEAPAVADATLTVAYGISTPVELAGTDSDGDALQFRVLDGPQHGALSGTPPHLVYAPAASFVGEDGFTYVANDGLADSAPARVLITVVQVNSPPRIVSSPTILVEVVSQPGGPATFEYLYSIQASDPENELVSYSLVSGPAGMVLDPASGALRWLVHRSDGGVHAVTIRATDPQGLFDEQRFELTVVAPNSPPVFTSNPSTVASVSVPYIYVATASDPDGDLLAFALVEPPTGMSIDVATGEVDWTPVASQAGTATLTVTVSDGNGGLAQQTFQIAVEAQDNRSPLITSTPAIAVNERSSFLYDVDATDPDTGDVLTYSDSLPTAGATINPGSGAVQWPARSDWVGTTSQDNPACTAPLRDATPWLNVSSWTMVRTAGVHGEKADWYADPSDPTLAVLLQNAAPSMFLSSQWLTEGAIEFQVKTTDGDNDGIGFVWGYRDAQHYYVFKWDQGNCACMFVHRVDTLLPTVEGGGVPGVSTIARLNDVAWQQNIAYTIVLDVRPGYAFIVVRQGPQVLGTLAIQDSTFVGGLFGFYNQSQGYTYYRARRLPLTAAPDLTIERLQWSGSAAMASVRNRGVATRPEQFAVAFDGVNSQSGTVVRSLGIASIAVPEPGMSVDVEVPLTRANTNFDALRVRADALNMVDECTEGNNQRSAALFSNRATDPAGLFDEQSHAVQVDNVDDPPAFTSTPPPGIGIGRTLAYQATAQDQDPGDELRYELIEGPPGMDVHPFSGAVHWTPNPGDLALSHQVTLRATDLSGLSAEQHFSMLVHHDPQIVSVPNTTMTPEPYGYASYSYQVQAQDVDGHALTYTMVQGPPNSTFNPTTRTLSWYMRPLNYGYMEEVMFRVTDAFGGVAIQTYRINAFNVEGFNTSPTIVSTPMLSGRRGIDYRYQLVTQDADSTNAELRYSLLEGPAGMSFLSHSLLNWRPSVTQFGQFPVTVQVEDEYFARDIQTWLISVDVPLDNVAPVITSAPVTLVPPGGAYLYDVQATDANLDTLTYLLTQGPVGTTINAATGLIQWAPTAQQLGTHPLLVTVRDDRGASATQAFNVKVAIPGSNASPIISSSPILFAAVGSSYAYDVAATDADGDALTYSLAVAPSGMTIDGSSGLISWQPSTAQVGVRSVEVRAADGYGGVATQQFDITVAAFPNRAPEIVSTPELVASIGVQYLYDVVATDADGDTLAFALTAAPVGMSIDATTGAIAWVPASAQTGSHSVSIAVSDGRTGIAAQQFPVFVAGPANSVPQISSNAPALAKVGREYLYAVVASDADGDALSYSLTQAPPGMTVDAGTGLVRWTPVSAGSTAAAVRVADAQSHTVQSWSINVLAAEMLLDAVVTVTPASVAPGDPVTISVVVVGAVVGTTVTATLDGQPLNFDPDGSTELTPTGLGRHEVVVSTTDGVESDTTSAEFFVAEPGDTEGPLVELLSPSDDSEVTAPAEVRGSVTDASLASWQLAVRPANSPEAVPTILAEGSDAFSDSTLATFDPTLLLNGQYALILQATDSSGNVGFDSAVVRVTGDMKIGHFSITFEDVSIPLAGIPITVSRTYDTRQRNESLAFGMGWSVDYQNVRLRESHRLGYAWNLEQINQGLANVLWCVRSNGNRRVTVTLPDGQVETFRARADFQGSECQQFVPPELVQLKFDAVDGTDSALEQTDYGSLRVMRVSGTDVAHLADFDAPDQPVDPRHYRLTTPEGVVYELDQAFGVTRVIEPNGNTLTYSDAGILHSSGVSVAFERDAQGRIEAIVLPDGERLGYSYTSGGDLAAVADPLQQATTFTYKPGFPHYLQDIVDARGVPVSRNEYDDDGRLVATIDAEGHRIEYTHDITGRTERVRDRRGNASLYEYDDNGWVLSETNALNQTIAHTYDGDGNELTRTDPLGHTTIWTYDARGNVLTESNDLGETTISTYNARNALLTQVDALGNTVLTNTYNAQTGALTSTRDALNHATSFTYDSELLSGQTGELIGMEDALHHETTFELDNGGHGWRTGETDALGHRTAYTHDANGRVVTETRTRTDAAGATQQLVTTYTYDDKGRVIRTDAPDGSFSTTGYNAIDKPERECDALSRCTTTTYDDRGNFARIEYPDGAFESSAHDENGNVVAQTDRGGRTTKFEFDAANRLTVTIHPDETPGDTDNPRTTNEYDAAGRVAASVDRLGHRTEYGYDDANRRTHVTDDAGNVTETRYDEVGRRIELIDAEGESTTFEYDDAGRLTDNHYADGSSASVEYDALSRKRAEVDPEQRRSAFGYDASSRLELVTLAAGTLEATETRYGYDEQGNRITQTDAEGRITRFEHDAAGREVARVLPLGQREASAYDETGQRIAHTDFNGATTRYGHDALGRVDSVDYPIDADVASTYTASGQRESVIDGRGTTTYGYDHEDRLVRKTDADGGIIEYTYDRGGNLLSRISPSQSLVYAYDNLNRLDSVTRTIDGEPPSVTSYAYDKVGNRKSMSGGDGVVTEYGYDRRYRLTSLVKKTAAGVLMFGMAYAVDASGMRTAIEETDAVGVSRSVSYAYDGLTRLISETIVARDPTRGRSSAWTYDKVGNRLTQTVHVGNEGAVGATSVASSYVYDANDRLLTETVAGVATTYGYDANGNTLSRSKPGELVEYDYDDANRLAEMRTAGNRTTYRYDADGLRVGQTHIPASGPTLSTYYLQDPSYAYSQVIEEWKSEDGGPRQLAATFTFADDLIAQTRYAGSTATTRFVHTDGFGSTRLLTDATGAVTDTVDYDAFGNIFARTGATAIEHLYRAEQFDPNLGFYYLRARHYDPSGGRFTQMDSFDGFSQDPPTLHKYMAFNADPVRYTDPSGHLGIIQVLGARINIGSAVAFFGTRAGIAAVAKFGGELAFEYATGIPVITSPRGIVQAVRSLRGVVGNLADGAIKRMKAGRSFESLVEEMWKLKKNTTCFKNGVRARPPGCFIPDFFGTVGGRLVEVKTSMGAVKKLQFQEFIKISRNTGQPMSMLFLHKPTPAEVEQLQRWAVEAAGETEDILLSIIHVVD